MNKLLTLGIAAALGLGFSLTSCHDENADLWHDLGELTDRVDALEEKVNTTNSDLQALQAIVNALQNNVTITDVVTTENGYTIKFSNGTEATISNGVDGTNAPEISVELGSDGLYYWTLDGELLIVDGQPVCATGPQGEQGEKGEQGETGAAGADAIAPQIRINPDNKMWEISVDGGQTWQSTGVIAEGSTGATGDSLFRLINTDNPDYIVFVLTNGVEFKVPRYDESAPSVEVRDENGDIATSTTQEYTFGIARTFTLSGKNIADFSISKPDGWKVAYTTVTPPADADEAETTVTLTVTAPDKANTYAEQEGVIALNIISESNKALIVKIPVKITYELRVLTFEDADAKFSPYTLDYASKDINTWSDLIDDPQYEGPMLYGDMNDFSAVCPYWWYDDNNTFLYHMFPNGSWGQRYWSGGHAISNYIEMDLGNGDFQHQLAVYCATGGHNGSSNFAMHYGYRDNSGYTDEAVLASLVFGDGIPRVVDHMYVMWNTYLANCVFNGNNLTEPLGPDGYIKIIATAYDENGEKIGDLEYYLAGPDGNIQDWSKWDLSSFGKVMMIEFNVAGDSDNGYGFSQPAYFAYDDVAVRFDI